MSERLSDVEARLGTVRELSSVVNAMRSIAAARTREALERLPGIRACAELIGAAIADAMTLDVPAGALPVPPAPAGRAHVVVAIGAEQGFVGTFNHRIMQAAQSAASGAVEYFVIGDRGRLVATEIGLPIAWSAEMAAHADAVPEVAGRIVSALYGHLGDGTVSRVTLVHGAPQTAGVADIVTTSLLPFDFARFEAAPRPFPPRVTLPARLLQERLAEEYVYTQLCEAVVLSFAAENEARMRAMIAARRNIDDTAQALTQTFQRLRQEQITAEIVELSSVGGAAPASAPATDA
ncbi:H+transporting two-sector ATPase gamma subunit [Burkholderia multivorans]